MPPPAVDLGQGTVVQLAAGAAHTCAVLLDGNLKCWGDNSHGELGYGVGDSMVGATPGSMPPRDVPLTGRVMQVKVLAAPLL